MKHWEELQYGSGNWQRSMHLCMFESLFELWPPKARMRMGCACAWNTSTLLNIAKKPPQDVENQDCNVKAKTASYPGAAEALDRVY